MNPSIGDTIHYVSYGTPGGEYQKACRAAIVTEVSDDEPLRAGVTVVNPTGLFFHPLSDGGCYYHGGKGLPGDPNCSIKDQHGNPLRYCPCGWTEDQMLGGTWHWPGDSSGCSVLKSSI